MRSTVRPAVTGRKEEKSVYSGHSAFRALFDIEAMKKDPELAPFVDMPKMQNWVAMDGRRAVSTSPPPLFFCAHTLLALYWISGNLCETWLLGWK